MMNSVTYFIQRLTLLGLLTCGIYILTVQNDHCGMMCTDLVSIFDLPLCYDLCLVESTRVLPTSRVVYQPINHRNLWSHDCLNVL